MGNRSSTLSHYIVWYDSPAIQGWQRQVWAGLSLRLLPPQKQARRHTRVCWSKHLCPSKAQWIGSIGGRATCAIPPSSTWPELRAEVVFLVEDKDTDTSCHFCAGVIKLGGDCDRGIDKVTASASDCSNLTSLLIVKLIRKHIWICPFLYWVHLHGILVKYIWLTIPEKEKCSTIGVISWLLNLKTSAGEAKWFCWKISKEIRKCKHSCWFHITWLLVEQ